MSKINNLIKELCPNGVKYKTIKEFTKVLRGKRLTTKELCDDASFPVYHGGLEPLGYYPEFNRIGDTVMVINVGASAGTVGYSKCDFWSSDGCYCIEHNDILLNKYLYHYLKNNENYFMDRVRKAGIPTLDASVIEKFKIAIPPLEVQEEIVRILDKFGELEAEFEAELEARKSQYEFWCGNLMKLENIEYKEIPLSQVYEFKYGTGNTIPNIGGEYPVYGSNGIVGTHNEYNSEDAPVIGHIGAYAGIINWAPGKHFVTYNGVICKKINENVDARYAYYLLCNENFLGEQKGAQPFVSYDALKKPIVKIPDINTQRKIVNILDKFNTLINDISEGIPAEIELRRKQYEYYRNKLLAFEEI